MLYVRVIPYQLVQTQNIAYAYHMKRSTSGFTIVELIVIVMVMAILSTIGIMAWNGVNIGSRNQARENDIKQWASTFDLYKSRFAVWPALPTGDGTPGATSFCLGQTIFQSSSKYPDRNGNCVQYLHASSSKRIAAANSATLMTEVQRVGKAPVNASPTTNGAAVGPFVYLKQTTVGSTVTVDGWFIGFFEGSCPSSVVEILPSEITAGAALLGGLPSGITACGVKKTLVYTTS